MEIERQGVEEKTVEETERDGNRKRGGKWKERTVREGGRPGRIKNV